LSVSTDPNFASDSVYSGITALQYSANLPGASTYYWKVTAFNICNDSTSSNPFTFSIFRPDNLGGLALWLKADSGVTAPGNIVSTWKDASGNGIDAIVASVPAGSTGPTLGVAPEFLNKP